MFLKKFFDTEGRSELKKLGPLVADTNAFESEISALSPEALRAKTDSFKKRLKEGETLDDFLPEAFACVREAARRTLGQRHYDVQLLGGMVLHRGTIAEMRTGEGKTLAATLPVYLNALTGKGVHVVTVNDYLARRDTAWMGQIYHALGLTIGCINGNNASYIYDPAHKEKKESAEEDQKVDGDTTDTLRDEQGSFKVVYEFLKECSKKDAYGADITYGTNNEFGFDYLRDNIAYSKEDMAQRGYHYAIVDEVDSILIDESRTPLIISAPSQEPESLYNTFAKISATFEKDKDFTVDEKLRAIQLTDDGITKAEKMLGLENIYTEKGIKYVHHLENAVRAKALFQKDKEYVVRNDEIMIVDEFTGRLQPGRRWSEGLHQAIEAKEGVKVQKESRTVASITFQNYFRLYEKLSGMTGTALTSAEEFQRVYNLNVISIPTHKSVTRDDHDDLIFQTEKGKVEAITRKVKELHEKGQPVLIGTVSIDKNEILSAHLKKEGVPHELLNAKNHEQEGEIIAQAGRLGAVTIATNMAGRGVDIILGGNPPIPDDAQKVRELGGLFVIGTERHEARRIDNQLRGRSGRQGDPGATQFYVSLEDSLMRVFASDMIKSMMGRFGIPEDQPIENKLITRALENAQTKIEGFHFDSRKQVLAFDDVLNQQRASVYSLRRGILQGEHEEARTFLNELREARGEEGAVLIEEKEKTLGSEKFLKAASYLILRALDIHWMEHLETMDYLRSSVNLRAYGQREPLVEYKKEGLRLFKDMRVSLQDHVYELLGNLREEGKEEAATHKKQENLILTGGNAEDEKGGAPRQPVENKDKVGRNDPCPCGAKKADGTPIKYKHCGLINAPTHQG